MPQMQKKIWVFHFMRFSQKVRMRGKADIQKQIRHKGNLCAIAAKTAAEWVLSRILDSLYGNK